MPFPFTGAPRRRHERRDVTLDLQGSARADSDRRDLSAVTAVGDHLWVGADEGTHLVRLTRIAPDRWAQAVDVPLHPLLDLPDDPDTEIDVEGLDVDDGWLWVVGSHGAVRRKPEGDDDAERIRRLGHVSRRGNRQLLARLPLVPDPDVPGAHTLARRADDPSGRRDAARLRGGRSRDALTRALRGDRHLGPFLEIPAKDNGFDIEGLAVHGERAWLGLRGPVLHGMAVILAVAPEADDERADRLRLRPRTGHRRPYEKFFLDLHGLGVRELCVDGDDLLVLAGPTMELDGRAVVLRWRDAARARGHAIVEGAALETVVELPYGRGVNEGVDHPEGLALVDDGGAPALLVVHDSPSEERRQGSAVTADLYRLR